MLAWQRPWPRSPPRLLHEETDLHRLGEDLVRVVSETLQPEHVSSFPIAARSRPSTRAATLPSPEPSWWYNCNIIYKMLEVLEAARLMLME
jgi:hypothetical protein